MRRSPKHRRLAIRASFGLSRKRASTFERRHSSPGGRNHVACRRGRDGRCHSSRDCPAHDPRLVQAGTRQRRARRRTGRWCSVLQFPCGATARNTAPVDAAVTGAHCRTFRLGCSSRRCPEDSGQRRAEFQVCPALARRASLPLHRPSASSPNAFRLQPASGWQS